MRTDTPTTPPSTERRLRVLVLALVVSAVASLAMASVAFAEALVVVRVRGEANGRVTLTAREGGATFSCETTGGTCRIDGVPGGSYAVRFEPAGGAGASTSQAMIPPTGTVTLHVAPRR